MKSSETLAIAKAILQYGPGWCQNISMNSEGQCCAVGALDLVDQNRPGRSGPFNYLQGALPFGWQGYDVSAWNDQSNRTKIEVLRLYNRAIKLALGCGD
jgi:hypothetical protein